MVRERVKFWSGTDGPKSFTSSEPCQKFSPFKWGLRVCGVCIGGGGGAELLPIHSLKWNPNDVLTTCKAISKGLASGFVYRSCALRQKFLLLKIFTVGKILVGTSYMIIIIYLNIFIISYYTTLGDRFASCENIVSRSQTSSLHPPTLVCIMYPFFVSKITCIGPIISSEAIAIEKCSSCNCAYR